MNRALVLGGGGARGSFQIGMLEGLIGNQGLDFQTVRGVSVGALNAAFLAQAPTAGNSQANLAARLQELKTLWMTEIQGNGSVYKGRGGWPAVLLGADSLYSLGPLRALVGKHVSLDALRRSGRDFAVGTVSLVSGKYAEWMPQGNDDFIEKLIASASIPVVFPFVDFKQAKDMLVDGGARNITPLSSAFKTRPDEVYVLLTSRMFRNGDRLRDSEVEEYDYAYWQDTWLGTKINAMDVLLRTVDILTDEVYLGDLRGAIRWNTIIEAARSVSSVSSSHGALPELVTGAVEKLNNALAVVNRRHVPLYILAPRVWFDETAAMGKKNDSTQFDPKLIANAIQHGKTIAADRKLWVWPPA